MQLQERFEHLKEQNTDTEQKYEKLLKEVAIARRIGTAAIVKKSVIDEDLLNAQTTLQARASSILIRRPALVPSASQTEGTLVFLSLHGSAVNELKRTPIPMNSIAGAVFQTGSPYVAVDAHQDSKYYAQVEKFSRYKVEDILACPLKCEGQVVGVAQFMNKMGNSRLGTTDLELLEIFVPSLAAKVADFIRNPENLEILGLTLEREAEDATVMFCDLTDSSLLFSTMNAASATDRINEYLEKICDVGLRYGAVIDTFMGDGVMFKFNVPRHILDHPLKGLRAAIEIQATFQDLKERWVKGGYPVSGIYSRIGISCGLVHEAVIGHPQHQHLTIMGRPVHIANGLCDAAARGKNIISIDDSIYQRLSDKLFVKDLPKEEIGKAIKMTTTAYELLRIKNGEK